MWYSIWYAIQYEYHIFYIINISPWGIINMGYIQYDILCDIQHDTLFNMNRIYSHINQHDILGYNQYDKSGGSGSSGRALKGRGPTPIPRHFNLRGLSSADSQCAHPVTHGFLFQSSQSGFLIPGWLPGVTFLNKYLPLVSLSRTSTSVSLSHSWLSWVPRLRPCSWWYKIPWFFCPSSA